MIKTSCLSARLSWAHVCVLCAWMNECLTTPQHEKQIGYWVSEKGKRMNGVLCACGVLSIGLYIYIVPCVRSRVRASVCVCVCVVQIFCPRQEESKWGNVLSVTFLVGCIIPNKIPLTTIVALRTRNSPQDLVRSCQRYHWVTPFTYVVCCHRSRREMQLRGVMGRRIEPSWWTHWAISRSSKCSTTGVTKIVVCAILSVGWCI